MRQNVSFKGLARLSASICIALVILGQSICTHADDGLGTAVTKEQRLEWFRQAKFGMFIHWGPYAELAGQWRGKELSVGTNCEWIMQKLQIPREEYREAAKQFNPVKFDADAWADLAATTGMKYVVLTAKHHDGFAMYRSRVSKYNIVDHTPFDRENMNDNGMPIGGIEEYWETPQTLNETWGYSGFDHQWKRPEEVIRRLVEIVSRGGNYLLNIGPDGEGVVPEPSVRILQAVGRWVSANGESIYGTTASPFHELPWGYCTVKDATLYLHVFDWPVDRRLKICGLHTAARSASLLTDSAKWLPIRQEDGCLEITVPDGPSDPVNTVIAVNLKGTPHVDPPIVLQASDGTIALDYIRAITGGRTVKRFNRKGKFHISKWMTPDDTIAWHADVVTPGRFDVKITYAANAEWNGQPYVVQVGQTELEAEVQATGKSYEYRTISLGTIRIGQPGRHKFLMRPAKKLENDLMYFRALELVPAEPESSRE